VKKPNVIFMIADDHRASAIAAMGDRAARTPVLDSLARDGFLATRMHIQGGRCGAVCVPTRATVLTGRFTHHAVLPHDVDQWPAVYTIQPSAKTMPEAFRDAGYQTHLVGKWHNCRTKLHAGFTGGDNIFLGGMTEHFAAPLLPFDPAGEFPASSAVVRDAHSSERFADSAIAFLRSRRPQTQPFFLYCGFLSPHDPRTAPRAFHDHFPPDQIPLPENFLPVHPFDNGDLDIRDEKLAPFPRTPDVVRQHLSDYYAMIEHQDQQMGRILDAISESGEAENTIVVYTADHGLSLGSHGLLGKQNLYESSIRTPFLARGPGIEPGARSHGLHQNCDIFPTLCDLAQLPTPASVEGESFASAARGGPSAGRPSVYAVYKDVQAMVKDDRWKLIRYYKSPRGVGENRLQLFDLENDPHELRDRAADPDLSNTINRLSAELAAWQHRAGDPLVA